jgi:hypothetical protein
VFGLKVQQLSEILGNLLGIWITGIQSRFGNETFVSIKVVSYTTAFEEFVSIKCGFQYNNCACVFVKQLVITYGGAPIGFNLIDII